MTCMTTKKKFEVEDPEVVVLKNNRYAYKATCPWTGKHDKVLVAFKFCSKAAYETFAAKHSPAESEHGEESEHDQETSE